MNERSPETTMPYILDFADPQSKYERVRQALRQCLDVLEDEFSGYGPREPDDCDQNSASRFSRNAMIDTTLAEPLTVPAQIKDSRHGSKPGRVPDAVARAAYGVYHHLYPGQTYERLHERGGFGVGELVAFLYARSLPRLEWKQRVDQAMRGAGKSPDWSAAYPYAVFPKPDLKRAHEVLTAAGMTLDAISADTMRHVVEGVGEIARKALSGTEP